MKTRNLVLPMSTKLKVKVMTIPQLRMLTAEEAEDAMETEAAAAAAKKRRKLPRKVANQANVEAGPCPPSQKPTRPSIVTSKKLRSCDDTKTVT